MQNGYTPMQTLIRLVSAGARGVVIKEFQIDWHSVLPLAAEQHVQPLVACALLHSPKMECPAELREYLLNAMRAESSVNLIRQQRIIHLLAEMKSSGIHAQVLKGYAVAGYYAHPECRGSVDTDLFIDIKQEKQAVSFMEEHDFRVDPRAATSHHTVCQHKKFGMVELHVELYAELIQEVWYQGLNAEGLVQEPIIHICGNGEVFETLGHTDQLIFLTLHMVKHFILEGLTLRMMLDIAIYYASNYKNINAKRYWDTLKQLHYDKLINGVLWNMIRYGGFAEADFPGLLDEDIKQMQMILSDLEQGGYMGVKEKNERLESGMEYNRQLMRKNQSVLRYRLHMLWWKIKSGMKYMFPSVKVLHKLYPITQQRPVLMPCLWMWQCISFPIKKIRSGVLKRDVRSGNSEVSKVTETRLAMFKELGML